MLNILHKVILLTKINKLPSRKLEICWWKSIYEDYSTTRAKTLEQRHASEIYDRHITYNQQLEATENFQ